MTATDLELDLDMEVDMDADMVCDTFWAFAGYVTRRCDEPVVAWVMCVHEDHSFTKLVCQACLDRLLSGRVDLGCRPCWNRDGANYSAAMVSWRPV